MNKVFIIDKFKNPGLLKFTETKLFFNANNVATNFVNDCTIVDDEQDIDPLDAGIIINSGDFLTTNLRRELGQVDKLVDARAHPGVIKFTPDYAYDMIKKPPYEQGSKQLYIIENLYKTILRSKKLIYLENTEDVTTISVPDNIENFYGLASGWKSIQLIMELGIDRFKNITIYDVNPTQLEFQRSLHQMPVLPDTVDLTVPVCGTYSPSTQIKNFWTQWHTTNVNFVQLDLMKTPIFDSNSLVWVSNIFCYEPNIFNYGWKHSKEAKERLHNANKSCIII